MENTVNIMSTVAEVTQYFIDNPNVTEIETTFECSIISQVDIRAAIRFQRDAGGSWLMINVFDDNNRYTELQQYIVQVINKVHRPSLSKLVIQKHFMVESMHGNSILTTNISRDDVNKMKLYQLISDLIEWHKSTEISEKFFFSK